MDESPTKHTAETGTLSEDRVALNEQEHPVGGGALRSGWEFIQGKVLLTYLRLRHRALVRRVMALAVHLEDDIFPAMRSRDQRWLDLEVRDCDFSVVAGGDARHALSEFPGLAAIGEALSSFGVCRLRLETALEYGQIVDAFVLLLHAGPALATVASRHDRTSSWGRDAVAGAMKGDNGYHRFCSNMSYDASTQTFTVEYTYCELFFQRVIKSTVQRNARYGDHRFLFAVAPRTVALLLLLVAAFALTALYSAALAAGLLGVFGVLASIAVGQLIHAIGSQHYTQEHLDLLVQNYMKTIKRQLVEIEESYDKLSRLEQLRDDLVHMVVHDMKNPLLAIISELEYLDELMADEVGEEQKECLLEAVGGARRLFEMVRSLLDVSRLEEGKMPLNPTPLDLGSVAREAADMLGPMARDHELTVSADDDATVACDRDVVRRIIVNLVSNALKYTPPGKEVAIDVEAVRDGARIQVRDCGPGIAEEMRQRIFEKFSQVEDKHDHKPYSTGLGLTFCKLAVEAHGGTIGVDSVPDQGSTFWFTLPRKPPENTPQET